MHRFTRTTVVATPLLIALAALPTLQAQTATPQAQPMQPAATQTPKQDPHDPDGDNRISWDEYRATMMGNFARLDVNRNDVLESTEIPNQPAGKQVARADFEAKMREGFDRRDADRDGYLAGAEVPSQTPPSQPSAPPQK